MNRTPQKHIANLNCMEKWLICKKINANVHRSDTFSAYRPISTYVNILNSFQCVDYNFYYSLAGQQQKNYNENYEKRR